MYRLRFSAMGCGGLILIGTLALGRGLRVSLVHSPRQLTERMLGVPLPANVEPTVQFQGRLGPIPTDVNYAAVASFVMATQDLDAFVDRLGCSYPSEDNEYSCALFDEIKSTGVAPPGTAEYRDIAFNFSSDSAVRVDIFLRND